MAGGASSSDVNAALVAQAARGPASSDAPVAPAQQAPVITAAPMQPGVAPQTVQPSLFSGINPFRQAPGQTLTVPGFQGVQNPFYVQPRSQSSQTAPTSNLGAQYQAYSQAYGNRLSDAKAANQAQLAAMQKAYQDKMAADKAAADAAKLKAEQDLLAQQQQSSSDNYGGWYGAEGGITSLMGRK